MNDPTITYKEYANQLGTQMRKGFLVYCVLVICSRGNAYSSDIIRRLHEEELVVVEGTIYPLLNRLQKDGMLIHDWQESTKGPPRKYYRLSEDGIKLLEELRHTTKQLQQTITNIEKA